MTEQRIRYLFDRYFTDSCTESERLEFLQMIREGRQDAVFLSVMQECWDRYAPEGQLPDEVGERVFERVVRPRRRPDSHRWRWLVGVAALLAGCMAFIYFFKPGHPASAPVAHTVVHDVGPGGNRAILKLADGSTIVLDSAANGRLAQQGDVKVIKTQDGKLNYERAGQADMSVLNYNTVSTPHGGKYQVTLADGTKVWLNAVSELTFPTAFTGATREVSLKGEAYFEVAPSPAHPFVVKVNDMKVNVLGTHFNIMAYDDEEAVRTTLLEGAVRVEGGAVSRSLAVGEQGVWNKKEKLYVLKDVDLEEVMAWKNGIFQYNRTNLPVIMRQIARWYNVEVRYMDNEVIGESFSGSVPCNENVSQMLKLLEMTGTVKFEVNDRTITVRGNK